MRVHIVAILLMGRNKVKGDIYGLMEAAILGSGGTIKFQVSECINGAMAGHIKEIGVKIRNMGKESINGRQDKCIMVST